MHFSCTEYDFLKIKRKRSCKNTYEISFSIKSNNFNLFQKLQY